TGEHRKALAVHEAALAAEAKAAEAARFNGLQAIDVIDEKPGMGLTGAPFRINYTRLAYDIDARDNLPDHASIMGFEGLPDNVFDFLIERHPQKIPDRIASLAPGNPREAFRRYFIGRRNGYVS